jgi:hypothetical protein
MVFHRCVMAVLGVLAVSASTAAGPIKFSEHGPPLDVAELRANGVRMGQDELRALFFPGSESRGARASCSDCLAAESSLTPRDRSATSQYQALFPSTVARVYSKPRSTSPARGTNPPAAVDLLTGPVAATDVGVAGVPVSSSAAVAPVAMAAPTAVPEPATITLISSGMVGAWLLRRRGRGGPAQSA